MKHLVKAVLPQTLVSHALRAQNTLYLATLPRIPFAPANLSHPIELGCAWTEESAQQGWQESHDKIAEQFTDNDALGGINPGDRRAIYYLTLHLKPEKILEIGTHIGASTLYMAGALKKLGGARHLTTVDIVDVNAESGPWKQAGLQEPPASLAKKLGCSDIIEFHTGSSLSFMRGANKKFDLIFLDGDHGARTVYREVSAALSLLAPGGFILLHDYYPDARPLFSNNVSISGPYLALRRIQKECAGITVLPLGELPWPTKLGSRNTSLALVAKNDS